MEDITQVTVESTFIDRRDRENEFLDACFHAFIILVDLCNSTRIKQKMTFPNWVFVIQDFFETIEKQFELKKVFPIKYLGDAILYMIPDYNDKNSVKYMKANNKNIPILNINEIIDLCINIRNDWWNKNKRFIKHKELFDNFMSITITLDYGLIFDFNQRKESSSIDPLGIPVDRCFRLSKYAGKNHIIFSEEFIQKLESNNKKYSEDNIVPIKIQSPKGFDDLNIVYVHKPSSEETGWILSYDYDQLIYDSDKPLNQRIQTYMLLEEINNLRRNI